MKFKFALTAIGSVLMIGLFTTQVMAAEILTVEDFRQKVVSEENLVKTADNAIFMFDGSSSMGKMFKDTNTPKVTESSDSEEISAGTKHVFSKPRLYFWSV
jgi:hypothetical protein